MISVVPIELIGLDDLVEFRSILEEQRQIGGENAVSDLVQHLPVLFR